MHACMNTKQYTIRSIPQNVDRIIRKKAKLTGRSINQVIIDDIMQANGLNTTSKLTGALEGLEWFVGSGDLDDATLQALDEDDRIQKSLVNSENKKLDNLFI